MRRYWVITGVLGGDLASSVTRRDSSLLPHRTANGPHHQGRQPCFIDQPRMVQTNVVRPARSRGFRMRKTIDFLLNDWLDVASLAARERYSEHSRETFASVLDTCQRIADEKFAPFNRLVDVQEPRLENGAVILPQCAYDAARAY